MEINLKDVLKILLKKIWIILLASVLCSVLFFSVSEFVIPPTYTTTAKMLVNPQGSHNSPTGSGNLNQITYNERIVSTYIEILRTNDFLSKVSEKLHNAYTPDELRRIITISAVNNTQMFNIAVNHKNPNYSFAITNAVVELAPMHIVNIYPTDSLGLVESPSMPVKPSGPDVLRNTVLGFLIGFAFSCVVIVLMHLIDTRLKSEEDLTNNFDIPILGSIPKIATGKKED